MPDETPQSPAPETQDAPDGAPEVTESVANEPAAQAEAPETTAAEATPASAPAQVAEVPTAAAAEASPTDAVPALADASPVSFAPAGSPVDAVAEVHAAVDAAHESAPPMRALDVEETKGLAAGVTEAEDPPPPSSKPGPDWEAIADRIAAEEKEQPSDPSSPMARLMAYHARSGTALADLLHATRDVMDQLEASGSTAKEETLFAQAVDILDGAVPSAPAQSMSPAEVQDLAKRMASLAAGALVVVSTTYHGDGCPDPQARKLAKDRGFAYDAHHPAQPGELIVGLPAHEVTRLLKTKSFRKAP